MSQLTVILAAITAACLISAGNASTVRCESTAECERIILAGSECINGFCSNPYHKGGCLARRVEGWNRTRVCSSDDGPDAVEKGYCRLQNPGFDYMEIRMTGQNWESAFFNVWIVQILLSELLDVPVTLETGVEGYELGFYNAESRMDYGTSYDFDALKTGNEVVDCRLLKQTPGEPYKACAHIIPEIWYGHDKTMERLRNQSILEKPHPVGSLGQQGLFIPRHTALTYPSALNYLGLSGAAGNRTEARRKLAETFKRPTRWGAYCAEVSADGCATDDSVAKRAPQNEEEAKKFYDVDNYIGYFRHTEANDCDKHPTNCSGHFVDYPCGWTSHAKQQFHHLDIALKSEGDEPNSGGYNYAEMVDIWSASEVNQEHIMLRWWVPEALYQTFLGTDFEFQRISFSPPTFDCVANRVNNVVRCEGETEDIRVGEASSTCDEPPYSLKRAVTQTLQEQINDPSIPEELRSPGYLGVRGIQVNFLQIGKIFDYWLKRGSDKWNFDPRDAACRWIAENVELVKTWLPPTYPRVTRENDKAFQEPLFYVSLVFALSALTFTALAAIGVFRNRTKKALVYAQVTFLMMLLVGMFMVTLGSLLLIAPASSVGCVLVVWLTNLGYTLELLPLIVKINAINQLMAAAKNLKRKVVKRNKLYAEVFGTAFLVAVFLLVWTIKDRPKKMTQYDLTEETTEYGEHVVLMTYYCSSESETGRFLGAGWHAMMLIAATAMAFQTRKVKEDLNESMVLAILIYSHFAFVVIRLLLFFFEETLSIWNVSRYLSIIYSVDTIATCIIYFFPKILSKDRARHSDYRTRPITSEAMPTTSRQNSVSSVEEPTRFNSHRKL